MSGTPIASTDTYENPSLASMGLIIGSHVWSWGAAPAQSFILKIELSSRVVLSGNDLIIEEIGSVDTDDTWQLSTDGSNIIVFDPNDLISTNILATGDGTHTVNILSSFTGDIIVNGLGGDDRLTVDFSGGGSFNRTITFNDGAQGAGPNGDALVLQGGSFTDVDGSSINASDGSISLDGSSTINFTGLE